MTQNGGYYMIDCGGLNLLAGATSTQTRTGMYATVQDAIKMRKPVFAYNCVWGTGNPMTAIPVMANAETTSANADIIITASTLQIVVAPDDTITIVNMIGG